MNSEEKKLKDAHIYELTGSKADFDPLMNYIADASIVLLGEASHGTHEFYTARAEISKRLIQEKDFNVIAIEGDWPPAYRVNQYIKQQNDDKNGIDALSDFDKFPIWMWRNEEFVSFIDWLYRHNISKKNNKVSLYGLDVYSLYRSIAIIINELEKIDPKFAQTVRERYTCFDIHSNSQDYGYMASLFPDKSCEKIAFEQLVELQQKSVDFFKAQNTDPVQEKFYIEQNALIVKNAERYYRSLFGIDRAESWNIRDTHMMETIAAIQKYKQEAKGLKPKIIVWAHNSHLGDARATQMSMRGEINLGQLVKESYGSEAVSVGFTTYTGWVSAASEWDAPVERKFVRPALKESIEYLFHKNRKSFILIPEEQSEVKKLLSRAYLERAIGVIYQPLTERQSHYFLANVAEQFDVFIHYDETTAVVPLEKTAGWETREEIPETYPFGI